MPDRREPFAPDRRLTVYMGLSLVLSTLSTLALVAAVALLVYAAGWIAGAIVGGVVLIALLNGLDAARRDAGNPHRPATPEDEARVRTVLDRLTALADLPAPALSVDDEADAVSWTTARPFGRRTVHVTTALLDRVDERELSAVVAHELAHVAHRDAVLMTVIATPGVAMLRGFRGMSKEVRGSGAERIVNGAFLLLGPVMVLSLLCARLLSRNREIAADRGAALLLGSAAAVASTLRTLTDAAATAPDLRERAAGDVFHIVPAKPATGYRRLAATHPPLQQRLEELDRIETRLQR